MWAFGSTVTIHKHGAFTRDADGNKVQSFDDVPLKNVALYPLDASELLERGTTNLDFRRMVTHGPLDISSRDEVTAQGKRWKVDGEPQPYTSPLTGTAITSVVLQRVTG